MYSIRTIQYKQLINLRLENINYKNNLQTIIILIFTVHILCQHIIGELSEFFTVTKVPPSLSVTFLVITNVNRLRSRGVNRFHLIRGLNINRLRGRGVNRIHLFRVRNINRLRRRGVNRIQLSRVKNSYSPPLLFVLIFSQHLSPSPLTAKARI